MTKPNDLSPRKFPCLIVYLEIHSPVSKLISQYRNSPAYKEASITEYEVKRLIHRSVIYTGTKEEMKMTPVVDCIFGPANKYTLVDKNKEFEEIMEGTMRNYV